MPESANTKARLYNTGSQTANTDVLSTDVTPSYEPTVLVVTLQVASASTVDLREDVNGTTKTLTLNSGATLDAGELNTFEIPVRTAGTYNIQLGSGVAIDVLNIDERPLGSKT